VIELEKQHPHQGDQERHHQRAFLHGALSRTPVMPGVLILEALAQAAGCCRLTPWARCPTKTTVYYFVGIDGARFKRPVEPGDQLILESRSTACVPASTSSRAWRVGEEVACEAELMCTMRSVG
jgi:3-hydroxyacyl-[acyl-carrier-protein] dehydratase